MFTYEGNRLLKRPERRPAGCTPPVRLCRTVEWRDSVRDLNPNMVFIPKTSNGGRRPNLEGRPSISISGGLPAWELFLCCWYRCAGSMGCQAAIGPAFRYPVAARPQHDLRGPVGIPVGCGGFNRITWNRLNEKCKPDSVTGANDSQELAGTPLEHREGVSIAPFAALGVTTAKLCNSAKQAESLQSGLHVRFHQSLLSGLWADRRPVRHSREDR